MEKSRGYLIQQQLILQLINILDFNMDNRRVMSTWGQEVIDINWANHLLIWNGRKHYYYNREIDKWNNLSGNIVNSIERKALYKIVSGRILLSIFSLLRMLVFRGTKNSNSLVVRINGQSLMALLKHTRYEGNCKIDFTIR